MNAQNLEKQLKYLDKTWRGNPDELAILLSSSRSEVNIKDKFNLLFNELLKNDKTHIIVREWNRKDLAIIKLLEGVTKPTALFEFKLRHTCFIGDYRGSSTESGFTRTFLGDSKIDRKTGERIRSNGIQQDVEKLMPFRDTSHCYVVLGGLHPLNPIPKEYSAFNKDNKEIKYVNDSFVNFENANKISELANDNVERYCSSIGCEYFSLNFSIGKALGTDWYLLLWILNINSIKDNK